MQTLEASFMRFGTPRYSALVLPGRATTAGVLERGRGWVSGVSATTPARAISRTHQTKVTMSRLQTGAERFFRTWAG